MANFLVENNFYQGTSELGTPVILGNVYEARAVFSINASNELQATLWATKNGEHMDSDLGTASYTIYDKDGLTIGITEANIVADANGFYQITPVGAEAILDLTHYTVKIEISTEEATLSSVVGITLGE
jgi:hypothetical protein